MNSAGSARHTKAIAEQASVEAESERRRDNWDLVESTARVTSSSSAPKNANDRKRFVRGLIACVASGVTGAGAQVLAFFGSLPSDTAVALVYSTQAFYFLLGNAVGTTVTCLTFLKFPLTDLSNHEEEPATPKQPATVRGFVHLDWRTHLKGIGIGLYNNTSLVLLFLAPTSQAPTAVVVAMFQLQPVIALILAATYWHEYDGTPTKVKALALLTAVLFAVACVLFCLNVYVDV